MHVGATQLLSSDLLAGRGLHQRRPGQEDCAVAAHDHGLVAHRRDVRAACRTGAHHRRNLRDALGRHLRLVVEDAPEVVAVGEDVGLERQEGAAGVHEIDAGQAVLLGDLLRAQVLLDGHGEVCAALDRRVVGDDHTLLSLDHTDAGDDARGGRLAVVHLPRRQRVELQEGRVGIAERLDALAGKQLVARAMLGNSILAASAFDLRDALA
jgi:hypothetical protein